MTTPLSTNATVNPTSVLVNDCPTSLDWLERASIYVEDLATNTGFMRHMSLISY